MKAPSKNNFGTTAVICSFVLSVVVVISAVFALVGCKGGDKRIGDTCKSGAECKTEYCRQGICSRSDCTNHSDCGGANGRCLPVGDCVLICNNDADCPSETVCDYHPIVNLNIGVGFDRSKKMVRKLRREVGLFKQCLRRR